MDSLTTWCGFIGAWLLVAGSMYQAALELAAEEAEYDRLRRSMTALPPPAPISQWWWLIPPAKPS